MILKEKVNCIDKNQLDELHVDIVFALFKTIRDMFILTVV